VASFANYFVSANQPASPPASHCLILLKPNSYGVQLQPISPKFELLGMVSWLICSIEPTVAALMGFFSIFPNLYANSSSIQVAILQHSSPVCAQEEEIPCNWSCSIFRTSDLKNTNTPTHKKQVKKPQ
jgi:hypothetical protein